VQGRECICNIDCSGHNENPVCATDGNSYNNPCLVREASLLPTVVQNDFISVN
uniref:Kazal-like domain-containing protein n=1 Tax=Xiphophorus couchianus TaxID=32473 RepID=A0A3B5MDV0_9TELE